MLETGTSEPHSEKPEKQEHAAGCLLKARRKQSLQKRLTAPTIAQALKTSAVGRPGNMEDSSGLTTISSSGKVGVEPQRKEVTSASLQRHCNLCKTVEMKHES